MTSVLLAFVLALGSGGPSAAGEKRARELAKELMVAYDLGHFKKALGLAEKAYELDQRPGLLFNLAQCHRGLEHWKQAAFFYRGYLRGRPDAENRDAVVALIAEMDARERQGEANAVKVPTRGPEGPASVTAPAPRERPPLPCVVPPAQLSAWPPGASPAVSASDCYQRELARLDAEEKDARDLDPQSHCPSSEALRLDLDRLRGAQRDRQNLNEATQAAMQELARKQRSEHHSLFDPSDEPSPAPLSAAEWQALEQQYAKQGRTDDAQANQRRLAALYDEVATLKKKVSACGERRARQERGR